MKIPVIMMFNDNYTIPGGAAIYSMLTNTGGGNLFELYVLHTDITKEHQEALQSVVRQFPNATLEFMDLTYRAIPENAGIGYPKEIIYKLILPSVFPQYDKVIVTDVDVLFLDDVAPEFIAFDSDDYFAGVKQTGHANHKPFSTDITDDNMHFMCGAGYMIYNLKKMREDDMERKYMDFLHANREYLRLPDQEVLNIVSQPKIKMLHPRNMTLCAWYVPENYVFKYDYNSTKEEHEEAKRSPVQLHFVEHTWRKPWFDPNCPRAELWFEYLSKTPFLSEYFKTYWVLKSSLPIPAWRRLLASVIPVKKWRRKIRRRK